MSHDENQSVTHEVDGITELDNQLPPWWVWLFHLSIVFSVIYMLYFHVFHFGNLPATQYEREMAAALSAKQAAAAAAPEAPAASGPSSDSAVLAQGRTVYLANCLACHGVDGGGLIGPNLTDEYFLHGATYEDSVHTITEGVLEKGMIAWKAILRPDDIQAVASFIYTLRGTTPAAPKAAEGVKAES